MRNSPGSARWRKIRQERTAQTKVRESDDTVASQTVRKADPKKLLMARFRIHILITAWALLLSSGGGAIAQPLADAQLLDSAEPTGRIIVKYSQPDSIRGLIRHRLSGFSRSDWRKRQGMKVSRRMSARTELLEADKGVINSASVRARAARLAANAEVEFASPEYRRYPLREPNDPLYQNSTDPGDQSYLYEGTYSLRAPGAWDITTGTASAVIAIVDTGVLADHPELANRSVPGLGYDFVSADSPGVFNGANDGDGRDADPTDAGDACGSSPSSWHGTAVASAAAGNSNDGEGLTGVDWNASLIHARALGACGGTDADIIDALRWTAGLPLEGIPLNPTPATVVNLSIGGETECTQAWQDVIDELVGLGISVVIASGNEQNNALRSSPANCADVITVGSSTPGGDIDIGFSNYGLKVSIAAPGRDIIVATNNGPVKALEDGSDYQRETGSSFSAALVSGAISLMQSINPDLTPQQTLAIMQQSATPFSQDGDCATYYCGGGILNLGNAVAMVQNGSSQGATSAEVDVLSNQVTPLPLDEPLAASLFGYRDIRYFEITTDAPGMLTITSSSDGDLYGYLLNDKLSTLALDDDTAAGRDFRVAARVEAGSYFLAVERERHRFLDGEQPFELSAVLNTEQPDSFAFNNVADVPVNSAVTSDPIQISGLSSEALVTVSGGFYSLNGGELTAAQNTVTNDDRIFVALQSSGAHSSTTRMQLSVGAFTTDFAVTTESASTGAIPDENSGGGALQLTMTGPVPVLLLLCLLRMFARRGFHSGHSRGISAGV